MKYMRQIMIAGIAVCVLAACGVSSTTTTERVVRETTTTTEVTTTRPVVTTEQITTTSEAVEVTTEATTPAPTTTIIPTLADELVGVGCGKWLDSYTVETLQQMVIDAGRDFDWRSRDFDNNGYPCENELGVGCVVVVGA